MPSQGQRRQQGKTQQQRWDRVADVDAEADRGALGAGGTERGEDVGEQAEEGHGADPAHDRLAAAEKASSPPAIAPAMTSGQRAPNAWCSPGSK